MADKSSPSLRAGSFGLQLCRKRTVEMEENRKNVAAVTKVNCLGSRHRVGLSKSGRLILFDHEKGDEEEVATMLIFNPELRCRCHEIRDAWRWYTADRGSPSWYEIKDQEKFSWVLQAFTDSWGRFKKPTESRLLAHIPKELRDYARDAQDTRVRAYQKAWWKNRAVPHSETYTPGSYARSRVASRIDDLHNNALQRSLAKNYRGSAVSAKNVANFHYTFGARLRGFRKTSAWFKACEEGGCLPLKLPPEELWRPGLGEAFPPAIQAASLTGYTDYRGDFEIGLHWVLLSFCEETEKYNVEYTWEKGQCK